MSETADTLLNKSNQTGQFSAVFEEVFTSALLPHGFIKRKNMPCVFLRLVGEDIVQVITYIGGAPSAADDHRTFTLRAGLTTVYRPVLPLKYGFDWLNKLCGFYIGKYPQTFEKDIWERLSCTHYWENDADSMKEAAEFALHQTEELVLPLLDAITDLPSALQFLRRYDYTDVSNERQWVSRREDQLYYMEDMLYFKTGYTGDFTELIQRREDYEQISERWRMLGRDREDEPYEEYLRKELQNAKELRAKLDSIRNDPDMCAKAQRECSYRMQVNFTDLVMFGK